jgi:transcription elongation factor GreA
MPFIANGARRQARSFDTGSEAALSFRPVELQARATLRGLEFFRLSVPPAPGPRLASFPSGGAHPMQNKPTYLSREGLDKLRTELDEMTSVKRPEVAQRIHDAKEHGDLSENAEYEDAKNEQAFVEGRIQTLQALIKNATIIDEHHSTDHVQIGSTVKVASDDGEESFTIVGSTEARPTEGRISNESPVGRALLGKKKGEKVVVKVPAGDFTYKVVGIS